MGRRSKNNRTFVMIDCETMGLNPARSPLLSVGAVAYTYGKGILLQDEWKLHFDEQIDIGRKPNGNTLEWWLGQSDAARKSLKGIANGSSLEFLERSLKEFWETVKTCHNVAQDDMYVVGNGANFDIALIDGLLDNRAPWKYTNVCCFRTWGLDYDDLIDWHLKLPGQVPHSALSDAEWQATIHLNLMDSVPRLR
jgi:DNA polymerase III epsilon subunit-like protein